MMGKDGSFVRWTPHPRTERMYDLDKVEFRDDGLVFTMLQDDDWRHDHRLRLTWIWGTVISYQVSEETYREDCWCQPGEEPWCFFISDASPWLEEYRANSGFLPEDTRHYLLVGTNLIADVLADQPPRVERLEGGLPAVDWPIPAGVRHCLETLDRKLYYAYPVGGCVRDLLLGRTPGDWDVCTDARPERVMALFPRTVPTGLKHGTVTVLTEDGPVEVTTFRREGGYADGRHPDEVDFDATLAEDLARRDFTVNAMALDERGMVIDLYGGQLDLFRRLIRCVGDPDTRFAEDALRMLRAVRFAAQLGFSIEEGTLAAIKRNARRAENLSGERIKAELEKILLSPRPEKAGDALRLGLLAHLGGSPDCPDLSPLRDVPAAPIPRWRAFCRLTGFPITSLPVERAIRRGVLHPEAEAVRELAISGGELAALGLEGRAIGTVQRRLAAHILAHPEDNTREKLLALVNGGQSTATP